MSQKTIAIVTGASAGLGTEFALQVDKIGRLDEIWLIARRKERLVDLAKKLKASSVKILDLDLTRESELQKLKEILQMEKPGIKYLINNAGLGKLGSLENLSNSEISEMINLNVTALCQITHDCIPYMVPNSYVLQVASSIGFAPAPYFSVYAATKAFVVSLTEAIRVELIDHNCHVIAVCPGPVKTEFLDIATNSKEIDKPTTFAQKYFMASAADVVALAFRDAHKRKSLSTYGIAVTLFVLFSKFIPKFLLLKITERKKASALKNKQPL